MQKSKKFFLISVGISMLFISASIFIYSCDSGSKAHAQVTSDGYQVVGVIEEAAHFGFNDYVTAVVGYNSKTNDIKLLKVEPCQLLGKKYLAQPKQ